MRVFNCGVGMALVVSDADAAAAMLEAEGETVSRIGEIETADVRTGGQAAGALPGVSRGSDTTARIGWVLKRRMKVGILISGRGSNMAALIAAPAIRGFPRESCWCCRIGPMPRVCPLLAPPGSGGGD